MCIAGVGESLAVAVRRLTRRHLVRRERVRCHRAPVDEVMFVVEDAREGGYTAGALGVSTIFTRPTLSPSCMRRCVMPWQTSFRMSLHT